MAIRHLEQFLGQLRALAGRYSLLWFWLRRATAALLMLGGVFGGATLIAQQGLREQPDSTLLRSVANRYVYSKCGPRPRL